jgi:hypothetical protein
MSRHIDWRRTLMHGVDLAGENFRDYETAEAWQAMWELLREAARVSRAFEPPPHSYYPAKASWPDAPEEMTPWQKQMAYLRGELDEMPADEPLPIAPTAAEVTRAEAVLRLWHVHALRRGDYPHPAKRHIYRLAEGATLGTVMRATGMPRHVVLGMKRQASEQMLRAVGVTA